MLIPIDAAWVIQNECSKLDYIKRVSCDPALDFEGDLPFCLIEQTGGVTTSLVTDMHYLSFDLYADTYANAKAIACKLIGYLRSLVSDKIGNDEIGYCTIYKVESDIPRDNPDPQLPQIPRVSFDVNLTTRIKEK